MSFCLPQKSVSEFLAALKRGDIDPDRLMDMTSAERRDHFGAIVGEENAREVNTLFESKMLLVDQKRGLVTWAKQMAGISDKAKLDFIGKVVKLQTVLEPAQERAFLADLAAQKIGAAITPDEAKTISEGAQKIVALRNAWDGSKWSSEDARLAYGTAHVQYQEYVGALLRDSNALTFKEWIRSPKAMFMDLASTTKAIVASLDDSFFGRQGVKMLYTNPTTWTSAFLKSWVDIARTLRGGDPMLALKADINSRPNAMNGAYRNAKIALGLEFEEAFPTSLPEKIPFLGRLYKASENAYVGGALRLRADYADKMIRLATETGVDMTRPGEQPELIGKLVNSMTGRGSIGRMSGEAINAAFFSIRFLKSNFDTLTMHLADTGIENTPAANFVRKQAAMNLVKIAGGIGAVLFTANQLWPGSVDWDPRSANFGKIRIGNTRFDVTGGMGSLVTLASRLVPTLHNRQWSFWNKSAQSGNWTDLTAGKYGQQSALDVMESFWEGKLAPMAGVVRDVWKGKTFSGQPVTVGGAAQALLVPMGYQTFVEAMNDPHSAPLLAVAIMDTLGFSANTYSNAPAKAHPRQIWDLQP